jgi:intracellular sulfur oxidation DsrE/DsrF family protein
MFTNNTMKESIKMNANLKIMAIVFMAAVALGGYLSTPASAQDYPALKGVEEIKAIFDFRDGTAGSALIHLKLVDMILNDASIKAVSKKPDLVVVFMGKSVTLLSKNRSGFSDAENQALEKFDKLISKLNEQGVKLEVCGIALDYFNVDPESVPAALKHVPNGWISSIGYQARGYNLVPAF